MDGERSVGHAGQAPERIARPRRAESALGEHSTGEHPAGDTGGGNAADDREYREVFTGGPTPMAICDPSGSVVEVNPALRQLLGYDDRDLGSMSLHDLFTADDAEELLETYTALAGGAGDQYLREQRRLWRADGDQMWTFLAVSVLRDSEGTVHRFLTTVEDSGQLQHLQERLHYQGLHDLLTGLPNRQFFRTRLQSTLGRLPEQETITLYHLGLDGLGLINNGLGYEVGDSVIKAAARTLEGLVEGEEALVARFGGTEFAILVHESDSTPSLPAFASMINEELSEPIYFGEDGIATSASIGVARRTAGETSAEDMIWAAEVALREAENTGKRQWALFDPERAPDERIDAKLAAVVPGALEMGGFDVTFRPIIALGSRRVAALWAQLGWRTEERGPLDHAQCLELAERSGVTLSLRDWLLRTAWEHAHVWHSAGYRPNVVVDLSAHQTQDPDLVATVRSILGAGELDPQHLWLSLPVEALAGQHEETRENVGVLGELGVSIALHGFHGSPVELRHLRDLPVSAVRLDPALVDIVRSAANDQAPEVRSVAQAIPLTHAYDVRVAVHGIETEEEAMRWRAMGCSISAGTLHGDPVEPFAVPTFLKRVGTEDV